MGSKNRKRRKRRRNKAAPEQPKRPAIAVADGAVERPAALQALVDAGQLREAVDQAKDSVADEPTPENAAVLVDLYALRLAELADRGLDVEARALAEMVAERYLGAAARMGLPLLQLAFSSGDLGRLEPIGPDHPLRPELERQIERRLLDPRALVESPVLASDDPLRAPAEAVAAAWRAACSGPVTADQLALREVSRRSPLAAWKLAIRAIDAWVQGDQATCEAALERIPAHCPPARLAAPLRGTPVNEAGRRLLAEAQSDGQLREALAAIDALEAPSQHALLDAMRAAVARCGRTAPELLPELTMRLLVMAEALDADPRRIGQVLPPPEPTWASLRLRALMFEGMGGGEDAVFAAAAWYHAALAAEREGLFGADSLERALISERIADLLERVSERQLEDLSFDIAELSAGCGLPKPPLSVNVHLQAAAAIDPDGPYYPRLLRRMKRAGTPWQERDPVIEAWAAARPQDPRPQLELSESAADRGAFKKALGYLDRARALGARPADLDRARGPIIGQMVLRREKQGKHHLIGKDSAQLAELTLDDETRQALVWLLRFAETGSAEHPIAEQRAERLAKEVGAPTAHCLIRAYSVAARRAPREELAAPEPQVAARALVQASEVLEVIDLPVAPPLGWIEAIRDGLPALSGAELVRVARCAMRTDRAHVSRYQLNHPSRELVFAATAEAMNRSDADLARLLFLRAEALPRSEYLRLDACLAAALALARRQGDHQLVEEILGWIAWSEEHGECHPPPPLRDGALERVLELERDQASYAPWPDLEDLVLFETLDDDLEDEDFEDGVVPDDPFDGEFWPPIDEIPGIENLRRIIQELAPEILPELAHLDPEAQQAELTRRILEHIDDSD